MTKKLLVLTIDYKAGICALRKTKSFLIGINTKGFTARIAKVKYHRTSSITV